MLAGSATQEACLDAGWTSGLHTCSAGQGQSETAQSQLGQLHAYLGLEVDPTLRAEAQASTGCLLPVSSDPSLPASSS